MKVLILGSKEYPLGTTDDPIKSGGFEIYTHNLVKHLEEKVGKITIITRKFSSTRAYEKQENIEVYRVPWIRGFYLRNPSFNISAFFKALTLDFDIILSQGPVSSLLGGFLAIIKKRKLVARPAGISYVQPQYGGIAKGLIFLLEKISYRKVDAAVFLSEDEKQQFKKKMGYLPKRYVIIPTGVEVTEVSKKDVKKIEEELGIGGTITVTFIGRLIGVKGIEIFIQALKDLKEDHKALIVGDGPEREKLQNMVKEHGLEDKVIFTGWRSDIPAILAASDVFVLPSYSEGLSIALLEAMAAGRACVVTDIGLPVNNGETALVIPPGDPENLARAIETLITDEKLREKLGRNAREEVKRVYSWEKAADGYVRVFNQFKV